MSNLPKPSFLLRRAATFARPIALIAGMTLLASLATLAIPYLLSQIVGAMIAQDAASIHTIAALLLAALAVMNALNITASLLSARTSLTILAQLRTETQAHLQSLPMSFHEQSRKGDLLALLTYEVTLLSGFFTGSLAILPANLFTAAGAIILLFAIDPFMALFVPIVIAIGLLARKLMGRQLWTLSKRSQASDAALVWEAERGLEMVGAIKSFAAEDAFASQYAKAAKRSFTDNFAEARLLAFFGPVAAFIAAIAAIGLLIIAAERIGTAGRDPADLLAFILYAALLTRPLGNLVSAYGEYKKAQGTLDRLDNVLALPTEAGLEAGLKTPDLSRDSIQFSGVNFAYSGRPQTLHDINLTIAPGEIVALTGENGAGKTALLRLLLRFYDADSGSVQLGKKPLKEINIAALRSQIGYVPQRALLFDGTIADNIRFGREHASDAQIEAAIALAQGQEFVADLPQGLDTFIGDNGIRLSGGQRQRIALARALLTDPPMLILDEATSMYDAASEANFVAECSEAMVDRTVLIVTHRPASLKLAQRVLHLKEGRLV
ncbi:MAG: ABC transporter ATP-binding protein [Marinomonas sp.]